jgi:hypothetical protein
MLERFRSMQLPWRRATMSGWVDIKTRSRQAAVGSVLGLALAWLAAAAPVEGECPSLDLVAKGWGFDRSLHFPPMSEDLPCDAIPAVAEVEKVVRAIEKQLRECIATPGSEKCDLSATHLRQFAETLVGGNQQTAYRKLCDLLREIYPQVGPTGKGRIEDAFKALEPLITRMTATIPVGSRDVDKLRRELADLTDRVDDLESRKTPEKEPSPDTPPRPGFGTATTLVVSFLALAASGVWWWTRRQEGQKKRKEQGASPGSAVPAPFSDSSTDSVTRASELVSSVEKGLQFLSERQAKTEAQLEELKAKSGSLTAALRDLPTTSLVEKRIQETFSALANPPYLDTPSDSQRRDLDAKMQAHVRGFVRKVFDEGRPDLESLLVQRIREELAAEQARAASTNSDLMSLRAAWKSSRRRRELSTLVAEFGAVDNDRDEIRLRDRLESSLPDLLMTQPELKRSYELALGPLEVYLFTMRKLKNLVEDAESDAAVQAPTEARTIRAREGTLLLLLLQGSDLTLRLRQFSFRNWLREDFRRFAENFYQTLARQGDPIESDMQKAQGLIEDALTLVGFKPMRIVLGQTPFDSGRHVGRGTDRRSTLLDGVIVGIVRYGFTDLSDQVVQPAEVIVNRRS